MQRVSLVLACVCAIACSSPTGDEPAATTAADPIAVAPAPNDPPSPSSPVVRGLAIAPNSLIVEIGPDAVKLDGKLVAPLEAGWFPPSEVADAGMQTVYFALEREVEQQMRTADSEGERWRGAAVVNADPATPFVTLAKVLHSIHGLRFSAVGLAVESAGELRQLPILSPTRKPGLYVMKGPAAAIPEIANRMDPDMLENPDATELTIDISNPAAGNAEPDKITLRGGEAPLEIEPTDLAAITRYATALTRAHPSIRRAVISAGPSVSAQTIVAVIVAARGAECDADGTGCVLPEVVLVTNAFQAELPGTLGRDRYGDSVVESGSNWDADNTALAEQVLLGSPTVTGALDQDIVVRIVRAHVGELRSCYRIGLAEDPKLAGPLAIEFVIAGTGKVSVSAVADSLTTSVDKCVAKAIKRWMFPKPSDGAPVKVRFPFELTAPAE